ncbi:MAG: CaiB/BaiF CoA-transferase family protein [Myxococcota bacterium]|nr:CaiB/BaiF CoA-transferase family protein [Myxococcota bacterium]
MSSTGPLKDLRVLDFSRVLSGPFATMTLADLGADVVKVEHPERGDDTRSFGPPFVDGVSTYFLSVNRGKQSIGLDLKNESDRTWVWRLIERADVLIENFRPGVMERLGLGWDAVHLRNPELVYCSISGFGKDSREPGYDLMVQGLSGIPSITGTGEPSKCGASIADLVAGMNAVQGILAALYRRGSSGKGSFVDVSMLDGQLSLLTYHASAWLNGGKAPVALGNAHPSIHPFRAYSTQDSYLNLAIGNDRLFEQFCIRFQLDWYRDERFATNARRVENREALNEQLSPLLKKRKTSEWIRDLKEVGIPCGPILSVPEALLQAKLVEHEHPNGSDTVRSVALPYRIGDAPQAAAKRAPDLGENREEILRDWLGEP